MVYIFISLTILSLKVCSLSLFFLSFFLPLTSFISLSLLSPFPGPHLLRGDGSHRRRDEPQNQDPLAAPRLHPIPHPCRRLPLGHRAAHTRPNRHQRRSAQRVDSQIQRQAGVSWIHRRLLALRLHLFPLHRWLCRFHSFQSLERGVDRAQPAVARIRATSKRVVSGVRGVHRCRHQAVAQLQGGSEQGKYTFAYTYYVYA
jgi:hypothetical protein